MKAFQPRLFTREEFRERVFERDSHRCVFCGRPAADAHHILERRLWSDGGYYLENGASVCPEHHLECERTLISVEKVREACGITRIVVPEHLYPDQPYDKWGNPLLPNGLRMRGELFLDASVQKVLAEGGVLPFFTKYAKHPRTHHVPWSQSINSDDRVIDSMQAFEGRRVIATVKMDGEQTSCYTDYIHARSIDGRSHPSRDWIKGFWSTFSSDIPDGWRVCGENLYAKHSIAYTDLPTYFMGFGVWDDTNTMLGWDEQKEWFDLLGITPVQKIYDDIYDERAIRALWEQKDWATCEGYVLRTADRIGYGEFRHKVAKFVREGHVQTGKHWMYGQRVEKNGLAKT